MRCSTILPVANQANRQISRNPGTTEGGPADGFADDSFPPPDSRRSPRLARHTSALSHPQVTFKLRPMEHRHRGDRKMTTARRRRRCCLVGAAIFSAWGQGKSSSSAVSAFGFGGSLSQQSVSRSLRWVGAGARTESVTPRPGAARIRSRTPTPPADGEALSATSRRRSAFVVEGGVSPAAASTTRDWRDLSIEVRYVCVWLCM